MSATRHAPFRVLPWIVSLAYLSLAVWMHLWALEAGLPQPGESAPPHHQVCTWIGTSGEAGLADGLLHPVPRPSVSRCQPAPLLLPVLSIPPSSILARAPPLSF